MPTGGPMKISDSMNRGQGPVERGRDPRPRHEEQGPRSQNRDGEDGDAELPVKKGGVKKGYRVKIDGTWFWVEGDEPNREHEKFLQEKEKRQRERQRQRRYAMYGEDEDFNEVKWGRR